MPHWIGRVSDGSPLCAAIGGFLRERVPHVDCPAAPGNPGGPLQCDFRNAPAKESDAADFTSADIANFWLLRALSARAPYFHNGIAASLEDVVRHYERRLNFVFTDRQRQDLVAFLRAL